MKADLLAIIVDIRTTPNATHHKLMVAVLDDSIPRLQCCFPGARDHATSGADIPARRLVHAVLCRTSRTMQGFGNGLWVLGRDSQ